MLLNRLRVLAQRRTAARRLHVPFTRAATFAVPEGIRFGDGDIPLHLPREHGVRGAFVELLLDDCYQLGRIARMAGEVRCVIDIGANVGLFEIAARAAFPRAVIHAYEPNAELEPYLAHQAKAAWSEYHLEAVGREAGRVRLEVNAAESVHTSSHLDPGGTIAQISLREAVARIGGGVDLLKIDCEGAEWEMLEDTASWSAVRFVTMEYHLRPGLGHDAIVVALERCGFRVLDQNRADTYGLVLARNERQQETAA